jgi:hypothetical protein
MFLQATVAERWSTFCACSYWRLGYQRLPSFATVHPRTALWVHASLPYGWLVGWLVLRAGPGGDDVWRRSG